MMNSLRYVILNKALDIFVNVNIKNYFTVVKATLSDVYNGVKYFKRLNFCPVLFRLHVVCKPD